MVYVVLRSFQAVKSVPFESLILLNVPAVAPLFVTVVIYHVACSFAKLPVPFTTSPTSTEEVISAAVETYTGTYVVASVAVTTVPACPDN